MPDWSTAWLWIKENWIALVGLVDLLVGAIGFTFAIMELRRTKNAVEASEQATRQTLQAMSDSLTVADVSLTRSSLGEIQVALRGERFEIAVIRIQETRTRLVQLKGRGGFTSDDRRAEIQDMLVRLTKLQDSIERKLANPDSILSVPRANRILADFVDHLSEWSEEIRFVHKE